MGESNHESANSSTMGEVGIVGTVELFCVGRLLRMGCDSFLIPVCGSVGGENLSGSRMGYHGNILLRTNGGRGYEETESLILLEELGRGRDRQPNFVACATRIVSRWVVVASGKESYSGLIGDTYFV